MRKKVIAEVDLIANDRADEVSFSEDDDVAEIVTNTHCGGRKELVSLDFHVLYHLSYAVPYISFNVHKSSKLWSKR